MKSAEAERLQIGGLLIVPEKDELIFCGSFFDHDKKYMISGNSRERYRSVIRN